MPTSALHALTSALPQFWENPGWRPAHECLDALSPGFSGIVDAGARLRRFGPLLARCFPELAATQGFIESPLIETAHLREWLRVEDGLDGVGRVLVKADHLLPVAGSIKARGGIYAVLCFAEKLALESGELAPDRDYSQMLGPCFQELFGGHELSVGSTGNLGLSIGIMGSALGFRVSVHMSREAMEWKKVRLRKRGVQVVEHGSDYTEACIEARRLAEKDSRTHFIDDENSVELFLGYSAAVPRLKDQLTALNVRVDANHPLFLYLPCGVGGAPGGITFAARHLFGDHAHAFFIEPTQAPCMLAGLMNGRHSEISVYSLGLTLQTAADGLAVSRPSRFVGKLMESLLDGCITLEDRDIFRYLAAMFEAEGMEVEPSSAAACGGPRMLLGTAEGRRLLADRGIEARPENATHVLWTTGGLFVPAAQHAQYRERAAALSPSPGAAS